MQSVLVVVVVVVVSVAGERILEIYFHYFGLCAILATICLNQIPFRAPLSQIGGSLSRSSRAIVVVVVAVPPPTHNNILIGWDTIGTRRGPRGGRLSSCLKLGVEQNGHLLCHSLARYLALWSVNGWRSDIESIHSRKMIILLN